MKKILQIIPYSYHIHRWWLEKIAQTISDWLNKDAGYSCMNISSNIANTNRETTNLHRDTRFIPSFELIYNFPVPKFWTKEWWKIFKKIKEYNPDIIQTHTRFFLQSFLGWLVAKRLWCKRIHIEHWSWFVSGYSRYIRFVARCFDWTVWWWIFRQCDTVVTISQMHKKFIEKFTSKDPIVIYNPVDYIPKARTKNKVPHIGFIWRLVSLKWVDVLIKALKQLENKNRICSIVGEWDQEYYLKQLTDKLWLSDRIHFVWSDDRANRLHKFDIFVNPSHQEWLPTTVVEALIAGCVVVATNVGGTKEISSNENLLLYKANNTKELEVKITEAFSLLKNKGSLSFIKDKFSPETAVQKYKTIYN